jgi:ArpU family phage transcriptional regulator
VGASLNKLIRGIRMDEQISFDIEFPELDTKKTKAAIVAAFEKYHMCKYLTFEEREASITASYTERAHGPTNVTSDQTASIAIYNTDANSARKAYVEKVERAVRSLPPQEKFLIEKRYMVHDYQYLTDHFVYNEVFQPPISAPIYRRIRWQAFYLLAIRLRIAVLKQEIKGK